jgi:hypothetical protein
VLLALLPLLLLLRHPQYLPYVSALLLLLLLLVLNWWQCQLQIAAACMSSLTAAAAELYCLRVPDLPEPPYLLPSLLA